MYPRVMSKKEILRTEHRSTSQKHWRFETAEAQFSELLRRACTEGPQLVTREGKEAVVVVSAEEFERLRARPKQSRNLVEFFAESPLATEPIDLERRPDYPAAIDL